MSSGSTPRSGNAAFYSLASVLCAGLAWVSYREILAYGFTDIDSLLYIREAGSFRLSEASALFTEKLTGGRAGDTANFYRPLVGALYAALRALFGWHPAGYHAFAIGLHALNGVLVVALASVTGRAARLTQPRVFGLLCGGLFVAHPLTVEVVPAVARYADLLVTAMFSCALLALSRADRTSGLGARAAFYGFFACTLLSKEPGAILLGVAPLYLLLCGSAVDLRGRTRRAATFTAPCVAIFLGFVAVRAAVLTQWVGGYTLASRTPWERIERVIAGLVVDLSAPAFAHWIREWAGGAFSTWLALGAVLVMIAAATFAAHHWRAGGALGARGRIAVFALGVVVLFGLMFMATGLYHRRYLYTAAAFACWLPALALAGGWRRSVRDAVAFAAAAVFAFLWVAQSPLRVRDEEWRSVGEATHQVTEGIRETWRDIPDGALVQLVNLPAVVSIDPARRDLFFPGSSSNAATWYAIEAWLEDVFPSKHIQVSQLGMNVYGEPVAGFRHDAQVVEGWAVFRVPRTLNEPGLAPVLAELDAESAARDPGLSLLESLTLDASHRAIAYPNANSSDDDRETYLLVFDGARPRMFSARELSTPGRRAKLRRVFRRMTTQPR